MITTEEVKSRVCKALAAIESKCNAMTGAVISTSLSPTEHLHSFAGTVIMTLSSRGNVIEPEVYSRTYAMIILMMKHYGTLLPEPVAADILCSLLITEEDIIYWSRARTSQLVAVMASDLGSLVETGDAADISISLASAAVSLTHFCVMHDMNEQELINDIPTDIDLKLG